MMAQAGAFDSFGNAQFVQYFHTYSDGIDLLKSNKIWQQLQRF
ncbi:MAG: hypothetical protein R2801_05380 [Chitinophagales bacterium]